MSPTSSSRFGDTSALSLPQGEGQPARPRVPAGSEILSGGRTDFALRQTQTSKLLSGFPVHLWGKSRNLGTLNGTKHPHDYQEVDSACV